MCSTAKTMIMAGSISMAPIHGFRGHASGYAYAGHAGNIVQECISPMLRCRGGLASTMIDLQKVLLTVPHSPRQSIFSLPSLAILKTPGATSFAIEMPGRLTAIAVAFAKSPLMIISLFRLELSLPVIFEEETPLDSGNPWTAISFHSKKAGGGLSKNSMNRHMPGRTSPRFTGKSDPSTAMLTADQARLGG